MNKLILGTASFGHSYGIKDDPIPSEQELEKISRVAWDGGIRAIHTSWQYGCDKIVEAIFNEFEVIRKEKEDPRYFTWGNKLGYSIYATKEEEIFSGEVEMLMIPINILDSRFLSMTKRCREFGWTIIARSVFLQGLLLMDELPLWIKGEVETMTNTFQMVCKNEGWEYYEAALGYVLSFDEVDWVIVGVNSAKQLEQLLTVKPLKWDYDFSITDENILDPRRWPK